MTLPGNPIDSAASAWVAKADRGLSDAEQAALDAWLAADRRHLGAYMRSQAIWASLDRAGAMGRAWPAPLEGRGIKIGRRRVLIAAAGGTLAAGVSGLALLGRRASYETRTGEVLRTPLADGSTVAISSDTALSTRIDTSERLVDIERGEAWFDVARDPARAFVVQAGDAEIRAVGTAFSVRTDPSGVLVLVTEGTVSIRPLRQPSAPPRLASAGERAVVGARGRVVVTQAAEEIGRALAWRDGNLAFDGETLAEAVAQMNRFNGRKIVIDDAALARRHVVGLFLLNEPDSFALAAARAFSARVVTVRGQIHLRSADNDAG